MARISKKRGRLKAVDFPIPKKISDADFREICRNFHIPPARRPDTKKRLDDLVEDFSIAMHETKIQPNISSDRDIVKTALKNVKKAADRTSRLGPSGRRALIAISPIVAPMLAARWICEKFPDDDYAPQRSSPSPHSNRMRGPMRPPMRAKEYFIEELTIASRDEFVRRRPANTISAVLKEIGEGLVETQRALALRPGAGGGPKPLIYRQYLIINLAENWAALGRKVSMGLKSDFVAFCEVVAKSIGWPTKGMSSAIPKGINYWRNLPGKRR